MFGSGCRQIVVWVAAGLFYLTPVAGLSQDIAAALQDCRGIDSVDARVSCYDRLVDGATVVADDISTAGVVGATGAVAAAAAEPAAAPAPANKEATASVVTEKAVPPVSEAAAPVATEAAGVGEPTIVGDILFGRDKSSTAKVIEDTFAVEEVDSIESVVLEIRRTAYGKLIVVLENTQIWLQLDSARLSLKPGDSVQVLTAVSGAYKLEKSTGSRRISVKRVD